MNHMARLRLLLPLLLVLALFKPIPQRKHIHRHNHNVIAAIEADNYSPIKDNNNNVNNKGKISKLAFTRNYRVRFRVYREKFLTNDRLEKLIDDGITGIAIRDGNWQDPDTWLCGRIPKEGEGVYIGHHYVGAMYDTEYRPPSRETNHRVPITAISLAVTILLLVMGVNVPIIAGTAYVTANAGNWSLNTNWTPNGVPANGDTVTMTHAIAMDQNTTIGNGIGTTAITRNGSTFIINQNITCTFNAQWGIATNVQAGIGTLTVTDGATLHASINLDLLFNQVNVVGTNHTVDVNGLTGNHVTISGAGGVTIIAVVSAHNAGGGGGTWGDWELDYIDITVPTTTYVVSNSNASNIRTTCNYVDYSGTTNTYFIYYRNRTNSMLVKVDNCIGTSSANAIGIYGRYHGSALAASYVTNCTFTSTGADVFIWTNNSNYYVNYPFTIEGNSFTSTNVGFYPINLDTKLSAIDQGVRFRDTRIIVKDNTLTSANAFKMFIDGRSLAYLARIDIYQNGMALADINFGATGYYDVYMYYQVNPTVRDSGGTLEADVIVNAMTGIEDPATDLPYHAIADVTNADGQPDDMRLAYVNVYDNNAGVDVITYYSTVGNKAQIVIVKDTFNQYSTDGMSTWEDMGTPIEDQMDDAYTTTINIRASTLSPATTSINDYSTDGTNFQTKFSSGSTAKFGTTTDGGVTINDTTTADVECEIFNASDVKQGASILTASTVSFTSGVEKTFYAMNSNTIIEKAGLADGDYYMKTTVSNGATGVSKTGFTLAVVGGTIPVLSNYQLSNYAITTDETTTATADATNSPDPVTVDINGTLFELTGTGGSFSRVIKGIDIGLCTAVNPIFRAQTSDGADQDTDSNTITVTQSANNIVDAADDIITLLQDSALTQLAAIDDTLIRYEQLELGDLSEFTHNQEIRVRVEDIETNDLAIGGATQSLGIIHIIIGGKILPKGVTLNLTKLILEIEDEVRQELLNTANRCLASGYKTMNIDRAIPFTGKDQPKANGLVLPVHLKKTR